MFARLLNCLIVLALAGVTAQSVRGVDTPPDLPISPPERGPTLTDEHPFTTAEDRVFGASKASAFVRGDANADGKINLPDCVTILECRFRGGDCFSCEDALDVNDDGRVDISDGAALLRFLFRGARPPAAPHVSCGFDGTPSPLSCESHSACDGWSPGPGEDDEMPPTGDLGSGAPAVVYSQSHGPLKLADWSECADTKLHSLSANEAENFLYDYDSKSSAEESEIWGGRPQIQPASSYRIVYHAQNEWQRSEGHDIYLLTFVEKLDDPEQRHYFKKRNLTNTPDLDEGDACWSPDGSQIAYSEWYNGIFIMNADGTDKTQLVSLPHCFDLTWSAYGKWIVFTRWTAERGKDYLGGPIAICDVYATATDGFLTEQITDGTRFDENQPAVNHRRAAWMPGSPRIAIAFEHEETGYTVTGHTDAWMPIYSKQGPPEVRIFVQSFGTTFPSPGSVKPITPFSPIRTPARESNVHHNSRRTGTFSSGANALAPDGRS